MMQLTKCKRFFKSNIVQQSFFDIFRQSNWKGFDVDLKQFFHHCVFRMERHSARCLAQKSFLSFWTIKSNLNP